MIAERAERAENIERNLGLVHSCANRFRGRGMEYEDLFQAGCIGLVKAVDGFDASRGLCFSTYAVPVILGEIKRLFRDGGAVKVSRSLKDLHMKIARQREWHLKHTGAEPTISELASALETSEENVIESITAMQPVVSLTAEDDSDKERQLDLPSHSIEEELGETLSLREVLGRFPEDDRRLIELRFWGGKTQSEVAEVLGMTQVQVSRREKKLLAAMRQLLTG